MKLRMPMLLLPLLFSAVGAGRVHSPGTVVQRVVHSRGFVEPHTPGSREPEEVAATPGIEALLGAPVDLNRVTSVRTSWQAHLDIVSAEGNEAVPLIADFIRRVRRLPPGQRR
jgi:hypothetical protein